ncbi:ocs element-binding factor 1-like [Dorcoceras hygrometricum]|uniref:Ocs element-binding factor 1-like n=1 Tax=Dorcoceras hygrometricum TaxID=472368 RepID=A0A2Z7AS03_9LAMI|nr:ocs element-binding factor 1-like [Dorcoceras hygrometricum]
MKTSSNKKPSRRHDRKVLVAEESTKSWADSDSDSSSSSSSSSDSEQEEVHCLMANQTDDDDVFDFSNVEFTRDDLVTALNDMTELSKLQAENEMLKDETSKLNAEIEALNQLVSSWNHSSRVLHKLNENQKLASDKTGVGFNSSEFSEGETSTQSRSAYDKFNKMSFVKDDMIYNCLESVKYDNQNSPKLSENGKAGIGFSKSESFKSNWLKNRLDKDKAKAGQKPKSHSPKSSSYAQHIELVSVRESRIQYLCDPQWFRDTASRGPTTIVAPESQSRTCPSDHVKSV